MTLFELTETLKAAGAKWTVLDTDDGPVYRVVVPFERWEIELRHGRVVRVERFISTRDRLGPQHLDQMLNMIGMV